MSLSAFHPVERNYLRSGASIPLEKVDHIRAGISDLEADVERIEREISLLRARLDVLSLEHEEATELLFCRRALLAPIRRLSPEVLGEIFIHCLPHCGYIEPSSSFAPLVLSQVCSKWREAAIGTPSLWSSLNISWCEATSEASAINISKLWLARSGQLPLQIKTALIGPALIDVLLAFSHRFRNWRLQLPLSYPLLHKSQPFPMLRELSIVGALVNDDEEAITVVAPALERATIGIFPFERHPCPNLPWSQLTHLTLTELGRYEVVLDVLRGCSGLLHLTFHSCKPRSGSSARSLVLPKLRSLDLQVFWEDNDYVVNFLEYLVVPNLQAFTFHHIWACPFPKTVFLSLVSRSACPLEHLDIDSEKYICGNDEQVELIESLPSLRTLVVKHVGMPITSPGVAELLASRSVQR